MTVFKQVLDIVSKIPAGSVASYGQIAALSGRPRGAQMVGWALHSLDENECERVPWHRVINARGELSTTCHEHSAELQARLLQEEGIEVSQTPEGVYKVDIGKYRWDVVTI